MRMRRLSAVFVAVFGLSFMLNMTAASAHYVYEKAFTWRSSVDCVDTRSEISHGHGGGYSRANSEITKRGYIPVVNQWRDCLSDFKRPAGYIHNQLALFRYAAPVDEWYRCSSWRSWYNSNTTARFDTYVYWGTTAPCGPGYYGTTGGGSEYNGVWHGGLIWSGNHYLPAAAKAAMTEDSAPTAPPWVKSDGTVDLGAQTPVSGPDGQVLMDGSGHPVMAPIASPIAPPGSNSPSDPGVRSYDASTDTETVVLDLP